MKIPAQFLLVSSVFLLVVATTWWLTKQHYDQRKINDPVFASLDSTIQIVNLQLLQDNKYEYEEMKNGANNPAIREKANLWKPKLDSVVWMGIYIHQFFEKIKQEMFMHLHDAEANEKDFRNLSDSLIQFKEDLFSILPDSRKEWIQPLTIEAEPTNIKHNLFYKKLSDPGRMAILSKLEFSTLQSVNSIARLLNDQIVTENVIYDEFDVLINQNSTYLLPGQTLEVSAGLGAYSTEAKPYITMNGNVIPVNETGVAIYKKLVSTKDSSRINVTVSFKDPKTGLVKMKTMMIGYTVLQPKN